MRHRLAPSAPNSAFFATSSARQHPRQRPTERFVRSRAPASDPIKENHISTFGAVDDTETTSWQPVSNPTIAQTERLDRDRGEGGLALQTPNTSSQDGSDSLPWYLRTQPKKAQLQDDHPFAERQKIPDLPPDPPPILAGLLDYISIELGLDDLILMDLRKLDPPAALGSNLLMLVGTARSEKHLNVCADRFCRWLRSNHKIRPFADGLLGRNELKLKLKRKNRRSKLLATAGAMEKLDYDDGISTGWVCVHAGQVDPADTVEEVEVPDSFVGFDERSNKVTLVVQMFTESKREETDLEDLWNVHLEHNLKKQAHRQSATTDDVESSLETPQRLAREHLHYHARPRQDWTQNS